MSTATEPPPHSSSLSKKIEDMKAQVAAAAAAETDSPPQTPAWVIPAVVAITAGVIEQGALLFGHRFWHPYSLLPRNVIIAYATGLLKTAPFVWPAIAAAASCVLRGVLTPSGAATARKGQKRRDISCILGGFKWDRNSFCRGWLCTGATGSGKTQSGVNPVMHQVFMREAGEEKESWQGSALQVKASELMEAYEAATQPIRTRRAQLAEALDALNERRDSVFQAAVIERIDTEAQANRAATETNDAIQFLTSEIENAKEERRVVSGEMGAMEVDTPEQEKARKALRERLETINRQIDAMEAEREAKIATFTASGLSGPRQAELRQLDSQIAEISEDLDRIETEELQPLRERLQRQLRQIEPARYRAYPWGGICVDEKGLYWQTLNGMARHYGREHHLMLLQTRPSWAPAGWRPPARFNLLSDEQIPANTYAKAIVDTATAVAGGEGDKGFFKTQAESNIGWSIELQRAVRKCLLETGRAPKDIPFPSIKLCLQLLSDQTFYKQWLAEHGCLPTKRPDHRNPERLVTRDPEIRSPKLEEAMSHFSNRYWSQPSEQLGGVIGTIYNYLNYFTNDEVAEVFCADNTFDFRDIDRGMILCVAMPQKLQVERRYVCTLLKLLFYQHVLRRFDLNTTSPEWIHRNLLICWQDEAQRFVTESDGNVDVIREAGATTFMACQSKVSLYAPLGGKEKATVTILNLRNRLIFQAADDDCATGSADFLGKIEKTKTSRSTSSSGTSVSYSKEDQHKIKPHEFRALPKFTAVVCHADGPFRRAIVCPITTDGKLRKEWLGGRKFGYWIQSLFGKGWKPVPKPSKRSDPKQPKG